MKIVLGLDGSPGSDGAARWVADHGPALDAEVTALHVVPRIELWDLAALQIDSDPVLDAQRSLLQGRWTEGLRAAGLPVKTRLVRGDPASELCASAVAMDADLLVIGAKSHTALHDLLGGTAHKVANHSTTAVVLVPVAPARRTPPTAFAAASARAERTPSDDEDAACT